MRQLIALLFLSAVAFAATVPLLHADNPEAIHGSYIVVFKTGLLDKQLEEHMTKLQRQIDLLGDNSSAIVSTYSIVDFKGYSARLSDDLLTMVRSTLEVDYVEVDQIMRSNDACSSQQTTEWGLDRISERELNLDGVYVYEASAGAGVDSYVVDTGIRITHKEFSGGRAIWGKNFVNDGKDTDCNGHGTHVAGTVGGTTYGVAKKTTLFAVKVLGCDGSGTNAGVIGGVQWAATNAGSRKKPSVANMSLGGGKSTALDQAVKNAIASGLTFVVAGGNDNKDACNYSPAGAGGNNGPAITVGATTVTDSAGNEIDQRASFSNFGSCLDIFAPGQLITSAWYTSDTAIKTISGTSMASPHVAGAAALYVGLNNGASPAAIKKALTSGSTPNEINLACGSSAPCSRSPNRMLYASCD